MSDNKVPSSAPPPQGGEPPKDSHALEGEPGIPSVSQPPKVSVPYKGVLAVVFAIVSLIVVSAVSINRAFFGPKTEESSKRLGDRPMAAQTEPRRLDMTPPVAIIAFEGMQSHKLAAPPTMSRSMRVTSAPRRAPHVAACTPAGPPPMMTKRTATT